MSKILAIYVMNKEEVIQFGSKATKWLRAGPRRADGEVPGLQMSLNELTGIISIDAPGVSSAIHISKVTVVLEPTIPVSVAVVNPVSAPRDTDETVYTDDADDEPIADDAEVEDDDPEVAALLQSPTVKEAVAKRKPGRPRKTAEA